MPVLNGLWLESRNRLLVQFFSTSSVLKDLHRKAIDEREELPHDVIRLRHETSLKDLSVLPADLAHTIHCLL